MISDRYANLKHKYGNRHFWCRGYYVDTVGKNTQAFQNLDFSVGKTLVINFYLVRCWQMVEIFDNTVVFYNRDPVA